MNSKVLYILVVSVVLISSVSLESHGYGLEQEIKQQVSDIMSAFKTKYKNDPVVKALFKQDFKVIGRLKFDPSKILHVKVPVYEKSYAHVKCDYIALGIATTMMSKQEFESNSIPFIFTIKALMSKGVKTRGMYSWTLFTKRGNRFVKSDEECGVFGNQIKRGDKKIGALRKLFKK